MKSLRIRKLKNLRDEGLLNPLEFKILLKEEERRFNLWDFLTTMRNFLSFI